MVVVVVVFVFPFSRFFVHGWRVDTFEPIYRNSIHMLLLIPPPSKSSTGKIRFSLPPTICVYGHFGHWYPEMAFVTTTTWMRIQQPPDRSRTTLTTPQKHIFRWKLQHHRKIKISLGMHLSLSLPDGIYIYIYIIYLLLF
jgi:hypothetical protein